MNVQVISIAAGLLAAGLLFAEPAELGNSRELFVDEQLIESRDGVSLKLHHPVPREIAVSYDRPHEGNVSCYTTIFKDGDKYRMYYNGAHYTQFGIIGTARKQHPEFTCLAESADGLRWSRPELNAVKFNGSKSNNILPLENRWTHCFTPFWDSNPACPPEEQYKAVAFDHGTPKQLFGFTSPDGIHWKLVQPQPIISDGNFDSQNLAFYDKQRGCYVAYYRKSHSGVRGIATATSRDFRNWTPGELISCGGLEKKTQFYTNAILRYERAPRFLIGFPMLFEDNRLRPGNWGVGIGDGGFMSSRDGRNFKLFEDAFLRPGLNRERWFNRCNYAAWGMVQTPGVFPGSPDELSLYYSEGYSEGREVALRRCTLRLDGFVSAHAEASGGTLLTRPVTFTVTPRDQVKPAPDDGFFQPLTIDGTDEVKHFGSRILRVSRPVALELPETRAPGSCATFAVQTDVLSRGGERRFFSAHDKRPGGGRFCFHIYLAPKPAQYKYSLVRCEYTPAGRAEFGGEELEKLIALRRDHHFAATYENGKIRLYIDGRQVAENPTAKPVPLEFELGNLRFGNDYAPNGFINSPFIGYADDILVLKRAMSPQEIAKLAAEGAEKTLDLNRERGMLYTMENDSGAPLTDMLTADGRQDARFPSLLPWGKTMLLLNCSTSARGSIRVELQDAATGRAIPGYSLADCDVIYDDAIERIVSWRGKSELGELAGRPIRILYELKDADLYAYRFGQPEGE
ncbi:LamG-like jellyroll fold domain-containing protein [Victivallis vadensis]|uniref:LamG-like jellyroll fold domain-containing protein n=1 Tax=Victivallis vadensis TaxID=172901 RepID=UPI003D000235